jgi:hypothetical protein
MMILKSSKPAAKAPQEVVLQSYNEKMLQQLLQDRGSPMK